MKTTTKPTGTCSLLLRINGDTYAVKSLSPNPVANPAWRLTKLVLKPKVTAKMHGDRIIYDVCVMHRKPECTCPDFLYRRDPQAEACKHILSLTAVGLLPNLGGE